MNKGKYWQWDQQTQSLGAVYPQSRQGHTLCYSSSLYSLIMFGGRSTNPTNDVFLYNISTSKWSRIKCSGNVPSTVSYHNSVVLRNPINSQEIMVVIGGLKDTDISTNQIVVLSLVNWRWKPLKFNERFLPRHHASICIVDDKLALFGGTQKPQLKSLNDLWTIDIRALMSGNEEIKLKNWPSKGNVPEKRYGHISFNNHKNPMIAWGYLDSQKQDKKIYSYSFSTQQWSAFAPHGLDPSPRSFSSSIQISPSQAIIFGGQTVLNENYLEQVYVYNIDSNLWIQPFLTSFKPVPRKHQSACLLPDLDTIYMVGGLNKKFCSMQISTLNHKQHNNDRVWVKNKQLDSTNKTAQRILSNSISNNYQQISALQKLLKEQNNQCKALTIMLQTLDNKRKAEMEKMSQHYKQQKMLQRKIKEQEEANIQNSIKAQKLSKIQRQLTATLEKRISLQQLYLLNVIKHSEVIKCNIDSSGNYIQQAKKVNNQVNRLLEFFSEIDKFL